MTVSKSAWTGSHHFDAPVLVTGLPRSGTSMVAGLLGICGLWLGHTVSGGRENIHGFFENVFLRERVQKDLLRQGKFDPLGVRRLPPPTWQPSARSFREIVAAGLEAQQYDGAQPWGFKDAKLTLTWRVWHEHFPHARWMVVRRSTDEIVASCLRAGFMNQHSSDPAFWRGFVDTYLERLYLLESTVAWSRTLNAGDVVSGRHESLRRVLSDLGLTWKDIEVRAFIEPGVWHADHASGSDGSTR